VASKQAARFSVEFTRQAERDLKRIDRQHQEQIRDTINLLEQDPRPHNSESLAGEKGAFRVRTGDYRILYTIDYKKSVVYITKIGDRKDVYRGL